MNWMFLPLRRYAEFDGRSRRMEFWMFTLFGTLVTAAFVGLTFLAFFVSEFAGSDFSDLWAAPTIGIALIILYALFFLAMIVPGIAVSVRRLHDRDLSGWWYLAYIVGSQIPVINFAVFIAFYVVMTLPGTNGANRFGADPKDPFNVEVFE